MEAHVEGDKKAALKTSYTAEKQFNNKAEQQTTY